MRSWIFSVIFVFACTLGCERDEPQPTVVPAKPVAATAAAKPSAETGPTWEETVAIAEDPSRAPVEKIDAVEKFIAAPGAAGRPNTKVAKRLLTTLEARRRLWGTYYATERRLHDAAAESWERQSLHTDELADVVSLVLLEVLRSEAKYPSSQAIQPVAVKAPLGETFGLETRPEYVGLGYVRGVLARVLVKASSDGDAPESWATARDHNWNKNLAFNDLLRPHLGADLFDESHPGRLNRRAARKLIAKADPLLDREYLGLSVPTLVHMFEPRLHEYDRTYRELTKIGSRKVVKDYRAAYRENEASEPPGEHHAGMLSFYANWTRKHGIAAAIEGDRWSVPVAVGFWMRRMDDGTARSFHRLLTKVLDRAPK